MIRYIELQKSFIKYNIICILAPWRWNCSWSREVSAYEYQHMFIYSQLYQKRTSWLIFFIPYIFYAWEGGGGWSHDYNYTLLLEENKFMEKIAFKYDWVPAFSTYILHQKFTKVCVDWNEAWVSCWEVSNACCVLNNRWRSVLGVLLSSYVTARLIWEDLNRNNTLVRLLVSIQLESWIPMQKKKQYWNRKFINFKVKNFTMSDEWLLGDLYRS